MEHQGQVAPAQALHKARQPQRVIGVAVAQDDGLDVGDVDFQGIQVVQEAVTTDAGVEQDGA